MSMLLPLLTGLLPVGEYQPDPEWIRSFANAVGASVDSEVTKGFIARCHLGYLESAAPQEAAFDARQLSIFEDSMGARDPGAGVPGVLVGDPADPGSSHRWVLAPATLVQDGVIRLKRYGLKSAELGTVVEMLSGFGFSVLGNVPNVFHANSGDGLPVHLDDIDLRWKAQSGGSPQFDDDDAVRISEAIRAIETGNAETDDLNRLVASAKLSWKQVVLIRAYRQYRLQLRTRFTEAELDQALFAFPEVAGTLFSYFQARFDPAPSNREERIATARAGVLGRLEEVANFNHDQILRGYLELIDTTVRTNFYSISGDGSEPFRIVLKFAPADPVGIVHGSSLREIFVYSTQVMGIHMRAGLIARGGIRWSERPADYRTEVHELAMAQVKKNAVIVPTGAKGGFVVRSPVPPRPSDVKEAYKVFVGSLLEVTDNISEGKVATPPGIVAFDGDDHYLVVAADKGTASFSDLANEISIHRGFWLGDAFASGGSHGYDHKALAITARGAWSGVRRHFSALGIDVQKEPVRVIGIGDMSGDIFGNGMLQSDAIKLVAAFDHRHIFLDPDPDPAASYAERKRLAALATSSWDDYDRSVISQGGGVWPRSSKSIPVDQRARQVLGISKESLTPPELVSAVLAAPVDLVWFGGIGTYIKDRGESDSEVGDSGNDVVRITSDQVRARVIAEGANLALTQRARVRYSRRGGRINTDFIDNAGGVAMSDHEVNLKILVDEAIRRGLVESSERDGIFVGVSGEVVNQVLAEVEGSMAALDRALGPSAVHLDSLEALISHWEASGGFDRGADFLPDTEEFSKRREAGAGFTRPELAVVQAYAKSELSAELSVGAISSGSDLLELALGYLPESLAERFVALVPDHPLYRQLVSTILSDQLVNRMGPSWAYDISEELTSSLGDAAVAFWTACKVCGAIDLWQEVDKLGPEGLDLHDSISRVVNELSRFYISRAKSADPGTLIGRDRGLVEEVMASSGPAGAILERGAATAGLGDSGHAPDLSERIGELGAVPAILEVGEICRLAGAGVADALAVHQEVSRLSRSAQISRILDGGLRPRRLSIWQGNGIRDDLRDWRISAAAGFVRLGKEGSVSQWESSNRGALAKFSLLVEEASRSGDDAPMLLALAVREIAKSAPVSSRT